VRRLLLILPLGLFVVLTVAFGAQLIRGRDPSKLPSALIDRPAPQFALPALSPAKPGFSTADLRGQVTLVNVFASWCAPCIVEHPVITRLAREERIPVIAINYKDRPEDAVAWLARMGDPFALIGVDPEGRASIEWGVYGVPETFVVDAEGRIRHRHVGPLSPKEAAETIVPMVRDLQRRAGVS
jgi:cytochrome c biogenesis protein CcmG/thiol:disulfide interchange protein DsbE